MVQWRGTSACVNTQQCETKKQRLKKMNLGGDETV
jgi:hypothetical protein